jgi:hypothetical protein
LAFEPEVGKINRVVAPGRNFAERFYGYRRGRITGNDDKKYKEWESECPNYRHARVEGGTANSRVGIIQDYDDKKKQYHNLEEDYVVQATTLDFLFCGPPCQSH